MARTRLQNEKYLTKCRAMVIFVADKLVSGELTPEEEADLMWSLAWVDLRDLESFRCPPEGFKL